MHPFWVFLTASKVLGKIYVTHNLSNSLLPLDFQVSWCLVLSNVTTAHEMLLSAYSPNHESLIFFFQMCNFTYHFNVNKLILTIKIIIKLIINVTSLTLLPLGLSLSLYLYNVLPQNKLASFHSYWSPYCNHLTALVTFCCSFASFWSIAESKRKLNLK